MTAKKKDEAPKPEPVTPPQPVHRNSDWDEHMERAHQIEQGEKK